MKNKLKALKNKADRLLQQVYVPKNPVCLVCGGVTSEMHHYVQKSLSSNLRYDPDNLIPLCRACHAKHHLAGDPYIVETICRVRGEAWADRIQEKRHLPAKINISFLENKIKELENL